MLRWVLIVNVVAIVFTSAFVVWAAVDGSVLTVHPEHPVMRAVLFPGYPAVAAVAGVTMLVLNAVALVKALREYRDTRAANFLTLPATDGGAVSISLRAIHHTLQRTVRSLAQVYDATVRLERVGPREKPELAVHVHYWVYEHQHGAEVETILREALRFRLSELLHDEHGVKALLFLTMRGIRNLSLRAHRRAPAEAPPAKVKKPTLFTGPKYPSEGYH